MTRHEEAKAAWNLCNLLFEFEDLLWKTYDVEFFEFLANGVEPDPSDTLPPDSGSTC